MSFPTQRGRCTCSVESILILTNKSNNVRKVWVEILIATIFYWDSENLIHSLVSSPENSTMWGKTTQTSKQTNKLIQSCGWQARLETNYTNIMKALYNQKLQLNLLMPSLLSAGKRIKITCIESVSFVTITFPLTLRSLMMLRSWDCLKVAT